MQKIVSTFKIFHNEEDAPTLIEYGLLITLIALVALTAAAIFGIGVSGLFSKIPPSYFT